jgi:3-deoxy-manno-octulosonate cytidylyltransferase (CMP-KDO synthetase)
LCFDLDGTLCTATGGDYERAEPLPWAIARVNELAQAGHHITIFTARGTATGIDWTEVTQGQLERWGVRHDELKLGKPSADVYIDDRAVHSQTWCLGDAFDPPGLTGTGPSEASDLFADLPVRAPAPVSVVELGRTFSGRVIHLDWHVRRVRGLAAGAGIAPVPEAERIAEAVREAVERSAIGRDVAFAITVAQTGHLSPLPRGESDQVAEVHISCRPLDELITGLAPMLIEGGVLALRAALEPADGVGWPLRRQADEGLVAGLGARLGVVVGDLIVIEPCISPPELPTLWLRGIAERRGIELTEARLTPELLDEASEAFVIGLPFCLLPIGELGSRPLADVPGRLTRGLLETWVAEAGVDITAQTESLLKLRSPATPAPRTRERATGSDETTVVIPARLHSTRLPEKVLADIGGRPMIEHVYQAAVEAACGPVLVLTDAEEVAEAVRGFGGEVWMTDPSHPSGTARIASVIDQLGTGLVVNLQGDAPLIEPEVVVAAAAQALVSGAPVTMPVYPLEDEIAAQDPSVVKVVRAHDGRVLYCSRSAIPYHRDSGGAGAGQGSFWGHPGLYAYTSDFLRTFTRLPTSPLEETERLEQLRWLEAGVHIHSFVIRPQQPSVDTPHDLTRIRELYESRVVV